MAPVVPYSGLEGRYAVVELADEFARVGEFPLVDGRVGAHLAVIGADAEAAWSAVGVGMTL